MLEQLGLGIVLTLEDNFTPQANTAIGSMNRLQSEAETLTSSVKASLDNLHHVMLSGFSLTTLGTDIQNEGQKILGTFKNIIKGVADTGAEFETLQRTMSVFFDDYEEAFEWGMKKASLTPFDVKGTISAMTSFKAIGIDVRKEFEAVDKTGKKMTKSLLDFIGDIGALKGSKGITDALVSIRELSQGQAMSFKRRFEIDPELALGRSLSDASNMEQFEKDIVELASKVAPNLMGTLEGSFEQVMANIEDSWEAFKFKIADGGALDPLKKSINYIAGLLDDLSSEKLTKTLGSLIATIWTPVDMLIRGVGSLIRGFAKFTEAFPGVAKAVSIFVGMYGAVTVLIGGVMNLAGKFIILGSSVASTYLNFMMLKQTNLMGSIAPLIGTFKSLAVTLSSITLAVGGLALAWNTNFLGIRDVGVRVANEIGNRWTMANSIVKNGLQNFKDMTLNDDEIASLSAQYKVEFKDSNEATQFLDRLQNKAMSIARPLIVLGSLWTALFGKKDKDGMVIFSDAQIKALRDTGMLTTVQTLVALRGRVEAFFSGFKEGAESFIGVMKKFMDTVLIPIKPLMEAVKKTFKPLAEGFKSLFGIKDDSGIEVSKAEKQVALMKKLGKAVGFAVGAFAGFKVVQTLSGIITKPFNLLIRSVGVAKTAVGGLISKLKNLNPFSNKKLKISVATGTKALASATGANTVANATPQPSTVPQATTLFKFKTKGKKNPILGTGQSAYATSSKKETPATRKVRGGYKYINSATLANSRDTRLVGQDKTNIYAKKKMFGLGGQTLYTRQADGSMKNLGTRGGILGTVRDKAKNFKAQKTLLANGASYRDVSKFGANTVTKAKKSLGTKVGTLQSYAESQAVTKAKQTVAGKSARDYRIVESYKKGETIGNRKSYKGMWDDIKKDTGMYYSDFGKGKQGEVERTRFLNQYMAEKEKTAMKDPAKTYRDTYRETRGNILKGNEKFADANLYKKKRSKVRSYLFGDKFQVADTNDKGNHYMRTVARSQGKLSPVTNKVGGFVKSKVKNYVPNLKSEVSTLYNTRVAPGLMGMTVNAQNAVDNIKTKGLMAKSQLKHTKVGQKVSNSALGKIVSREETIGNTIKNSKLGQTVGKVTDKVTTKASTAINTNPYINNIRGRINSSTVGQAINNTKLGQSIQNKGVVKTVAGGVGAGVKKTSSALVNSAVGRGVGNIANNFKETGVGKVVRNVVRNPIDTAQKAIVNPKGAVGAVANTGKKVWGATKASAGVVGKGVSAVGRGVKGIAGGAMNVAKKGIGGIGKLAGGAMGLATRAMPWAMVGHAVGGAVKNVGANLGDDRKNELIKKSQGGEMPVKLTADSSDFDLGLAHLSDKVKNTNFGEAFKNLVSSGGQTFALLGDLLKNVLTGLAQSAPQILSTIWEGLKMGATTVCALLPPLFSNIWTWITTDGVTLFNNFLNELTTVYFPMGLELLKTAFNGLWTWVSTDGITLLGDFVNLLTTTVIPAGLELIKTGFTEAWNWITTDGIELLGNFISWLVDDGIPGAISLIMDGFGKLWEWVSTDGIEAIGNFFSWLMTDGVAEIASIALDLGSSLMSGIAKAVSNLASTLWSAVKGAFAGAIDFALPAVLAEPVKTALGVHHGGLYMSPMEHMAIIRKDETVLPPDKSRQLDGLLKSGGSFNTPVVSQARTTAPVVSQSRSVTPPSSGSTDNSVSIQNLEIKLDAKSLSRTEAREQALMIMEEIKKINKERAIRQYS